MDYIKTIVSGKKKRFIDRKYNLDLSYITPRIIAMAYPATGMESVYRNSITKVSNFLKERHRSNFFVFNLSGKKYDNSKFENRVKINFINGFRI
jgi:phosphatidylinositol-3,4,5-trisphosphate 3-phosphatase/dual-specificity protein phosphatase PTEN